MTPFETPLIPPNVWLRLQFHDRTVRLLDYLAGRHEKPVTLGRAAFAAGMERTAFSRYFRQRIGMPFSVFLRAFRVALAIREMETHEHSVAELTDALGYGCVKTFERDFRRLTATTPTFYRARVCGRLGITPPAE
jgi:AraC-like DNA-binding protein